MLVKSQVKYIQSLSQKKFRDTEGVFVAEGPKIVKELLAAENIRLRSLYGLVSWKQECQGLWNCLPPDAVMEISSQELDRISSLATSNQVLAIFEKPIFPTPDFGRGIVLLLDGIQDPGNLGTIVRTADWFGLKNIICSEDSADIFNTKTVQATMASITRVQVLYRDLMDIRRTYPKLPCYAATLTGQNVFEMPGIDQGLLVIGNESKGIRPDLIGLATLQVTIPRIGDAESLNAAVATGILLSRLVPGSIAK